MIQGYESLSDEGTNPIKIIPPGSGAGVGANTSVTGGSSTPGGGRDPGVRGVAALIASINIPEQIWGSHPQPSSEWTVYFDLYGGGRDPSALPPGLSLQPGSMGNQREVAAYKSRLGLVEFFLANQWQIIFKIQQPASESHPYYWVYEIVRRTVGGAEGYRSIPAGDIDLDAIPYYVRGRVGHEFKMLKDQWKITLSDGVPRSGYFVSAKGDDFAMNWENRGFLVPSYNMGTSDRKETWRIVKNEGYYKLPGESAPLYIVILPQDGYDHEFAAQEKRLGEIGRGGSMEDATEILTSLDYGQPELQGLLPIRSGYGPTLGSDIPGHLRRGMYDPVTGDRGPFFVKADEKTRTWARNVRDFPEDWNPYQKAVFELLEPRRQFPYYVYAQMCEFELLYYGHVFVLDASARDRETIKRLEQSIFAKGNGYLKPPSGATKAEKDALEKMNVSVRDKLKEIEDLKEKEQLREEYRAANRSKLTGSGSTAPLPAWWAQVANALVQRYGSSFAQKYSEYLNNYRQTGHAEPAGPRKVPYYIGF